MRAILPRTSRETDRGEPQEKRRESGEKRSLLTAVRLGAGSGLGVAGLALTRLPGARLGFLDHASLRQRARSARD